MTASRDGGGRRVTAHPNYLTLTDRAGTSGGKGTSGGTSMSMCTSVGQQTETEQQVPIAAVETTSRAPVVGSVNDYDDTYTNATNNSSSSGSSLLWHYLLTNWKSLALGQVLSILLSTAGITQSTLYAHCGLSAPTLSVAFVYLINALHLFRLRRYRDYECNEVPLDANAVDDESEAREKNGHAGIETNTTVSKENRGAAMLRMSSHPAHTFCGLPLHAPLWMYVILAILDVEANYLTVLAYRYTTLTSVTLFDALAIPSAMMLSKVWLGRAYGRIHLVGVALCMVGVVVNVLQDYKIVKDQDDVDQYDDSGTYGSNNDNNLYPHRIRGDLLAIAGGLLYGINDVVCEICVRTHGHASEFLGMVGLCAGVIAIIQAAIVEREAIGKFFSLGVSDGDGGSCSAITAWGLLSAFVAVNVVSYSGAAMFLLFSEACFFNLSLLTGDLWTVIFSVTAQHIVPGRFFFLALLLIVGGVVVYEMAPSPVGTESSSRPREDSFEMTETIAGSPRHLPVSTLDQPPTGELI